MGFKVIREILLQLLEENIPKDSHPILCLAKTDQERAKAKRRREGIDDEDEGSLISIARKKRRIWLKQARIQRNTGDKAARDVSSREYLSEFEREKRLRCQATRGTVALFNAVKQHQTNIGKQLQGSKSGFEEERILTQVTTSDFLDRLSAGISAPKLSKTQ
ncbi:unnamed protein product [Schistosoma margrebowiei]|uniref:RRP15-like protein n=1 Tax=Schistosoma margrebowiei TaxID=48269 RepID=A0A183M198_9TREM|nr:unnamed protein product [Schistosoma margrebowiei]